MRYLKIIAAVFLFILMAPEQTLANLAPSPPIKRFAAAPADPSLDNYFHRDWRRLPCFEKYPRRFMEETYKIFDRNRRTAYCRIRRIQRRGYWVRVSNIHGFCRIHACDGNTHDSVEMRSGRKKSRRPISYGECQTLAAQIGREIPVGGLYR